MSETPEECEIGVVHRDLCPENLVRGREGRLFCVDNGSLSIGAIAEDLCRVWYRWPMKSDERQAFAEGYSAFGDPTAFCQPSTFWMVAVVDQLSARALEVFNASRSDRVGTTQFTSFVDSLCLREKLTIGRTVFAGSNARGLPSAKRHRRDARPP